MGIFSDVWNTITGNDASSVSQDSIEAQYEHSKEFAQNSMNWQFDQLNDITGGAAGNYAKNYAFRSPSEQGVMGRDKMEAMFPELSPWELSGSPAAGVSSAVGGEATAATQKSTAAAADTAVKMAGIQSQMAMNKQSVAADLAKTVINGAVSVHNNNVNNELGEEQLALNTRQVENAEEFQGFQQDQITANIESQAVNNQMTQTKMTTELQQQYTNQLQQQGIKLTNQQQEMLNKKVAYEVDNQDTTNSSIGKMVTDAKGAVGEITTVMDDWLNGLVTNTTNQLKATVRDRQDKGFVNPFTGNRIADDFSTALRMGSDRKTNSKNNVRTYQQQVH